MLAVNTDQDRSGGRDTSDNWGSLVRFAAILKRHRWRFLIVTACITLSIVVSFLFPFFLKLLIDVVLPRGDLSLLRVLLLAGAVIYVIQIASSQWANYLYVTIAQDFSFVLRQNLYQHLLGLPFLVAKTKHPGDLIARVMEEVERIQSFLTSVILRIITAALTLALTMVVLLVMSWQLTFAAFIIVPLLAYTYYILGRRVKTISVEVQQNYAKIVSFLHESLAGLADVKVLTAEEETVRNFQSILCRFHRSKVTQHVLSSLSGHIGTFLVSAGSLWVLWLASQEIVAGRLTAGDVIAFVTLLGRLYGPINQLISLNMDYQATTAAVERIAEVMELPVEKTVPSRNGEMLLSVNRGIRFSNVWFGYDSARPILQGTSFEVYPGEIVALVGASGVGKTTVAYLLPRLIEPDQGKILIDGVDIKDLNLHNLRRKIGFVGDKPFLFHTTLEGNLRIANPQTGAAEIKQVLEEVGLEEFVRRLPQGYYTPVGEGGVDLSAGQKQRLALARLLLRNCAVIILDEAMSSLDVPAESHLFQVLRKHFSQQPILVVAHRLSTVLMADRVVVLGERGQVVDEGPPRMLLARKGEFRRLFQKQICTLDRGQVLTSLEDR